MFSYLKEAFVVQVTENSYCVNVRGLGRSILSRCISDIPGVAFVRPSAEFVFNNHRFSISDGGDMGGDGLWVMPVDESSHPEEIQKIRAQIQSFIDREFAPGTRLYKVSRLRIFSLLILALLACIAVCFATLLALTLLPAWKSFLFAIPAGASLFYVAGKFS